MYAIDFQAIGKRLKELRISKGLTQEYIAHMANVNTSHISNIENNHVKVSLPTLIGMCNALGTSIDYILAHEYANPSDALDKEILHELQDFDIDKKEQILQIIKILRT